MTIPRCEPLAGDRQLAWCIGHEAAWPTRDAVCRAVKAANRAGRVIVKVRPRLWHPAWWLVVLRAGLRSKNKKGKP